MSCGPGQCCREGRKRARREREYLQEVARGERQLRNCARVNNATHLWALDSIERTHADGDMVAPGPDLKL